jgi:Oxidoreductase FAD-binding domain
VRQVIVETSRVKSLLFEITGWQGHLPGQHVDIRLIGEDGYQAQRSYSIASPPEDELIALTVERVENGEVSPYLVDELPEGDQFDCGGRSAATSFGASPWAVRCVSSRLDRESRPLWRCCVTATGRSVASPPCCYIRLEIWKT